MSEDGTKTCPQCAEQVKGAAVVCRFCGHRFDGNPAPVAPEETSTSGVAVASFISSLVGLWIAGIPLGVHAQRQIDQSAGRKTGRGFATAGIILGGIWVSAGVIAVIAVVVASKPAPNPNAATKTAPVAAEGAKPLWRPSDPDEKPSEILLSENKLLPSESNAEGTSGPAPALIPLLNKGNPTKGEEAALTRRDCVLKEMGYGEETEAVKDKWAWLVIALRKHEGAAEKAVAEAAAAC